LDTVVIKAALSGLETELARAQDAKNQIENEISGGHAKSYGYEDAEAALPLLLNRVHDMLVVVLEAAGLAATRSSLIKKWAQFEKHGGIGKTRYDPEYGFVESKPFEYLDTLIDSLRISTGEALTSSDTYDLIRLETILRKTAVLVRKRNVVPRKEQDIQDVMHDYLEAFFTEYKHPITITGITKDYKPDGGVRNLKAAIEFKYATTANEVALALAGIFEDSRGYNGSLDWTRFYSLIYQTDSFESEDRIKSEMARGGVTWKAILVTGKGSRTRQARLPATSKAKKTAKT
jgi:hypothetical protein